jgi:flagellar capping protein FliD
MEAGEVDRERKLLKDEWAKLQREKESVARERHIVNLEKKRLELIKARQSSDDGAEPSAEERQQTLREKAKEALRAVEAKVAHHSSGTTSATMDSASPVATPSSSSPPAQVRQRATVEDRTIGADTEAKEQRAGSTANTASTQHPANTQLQSAPSSAPSGAQGQGWSAALMVRSTNGSDNGWEITGAVWCAWNCSDLWTFNGLVKILIFFMAYILYCTPTPLPDGEL